MKICFAINNFCAGGAERVMSALANELASFDYLEINMVCFETPYNYSHFYNLSKKIKLHLVDYKDYRHLESVLIIINPDVIVSFLNPMNYFVSLATRKSHIPHISCERNNPYFSPNSEIDRRNRDEAFFHSTGCVFQTREAEGYFKNKVFGERAIIKNPVVLDFQPEYSTIREKKIVTVGRYVEQKNYPILLQAFAIFHKKHPQYRLETYGKNSGILEDIEGLAETMKMTSCVRFNEETAEVHKKICNASVFVLTSSFEGLSNALAEAAALGIPCIATDTIGARDIIEKYKCGIIAPTNNPSAIADAIEKIICNASLADFFSENGKRILLDNSIEIIAKQWLSFFTLVHKNIKTKRN